MVVKEKTEVLFFVFFAKYIYIYLYKELSFHQEIQKKEAFSQVAPF
jgi:hypothetical protein